MSLFWRGIVKVGATFKSVIVFQPGDGRGIKFWKDIWISDHPLIHVSMPSFFCRGPRPLGHISISSIQREILLVSQVLYSASFISRTGGLIVASDTQQYSSQQSSDRVSWRFTPNGIFMVRSFYRFINMGGIICPIARHL